MIISEKQIMQLITIAHGAMQSLGERGQEEAACQIAMLIDAINAQQSEKLKMIE